MRLVDRMALRIRGSLGYMKMCTEQPLDSAKTCEGESSYPQIAPMKYSSLVVQYLLSPATLPTSWQYGLYDDL